MLKQIKRRVRPVSLSLVAAAVTAVAFAALSFADQDGGSKRGGEDVLRAPGGPPGVAFRMELSEEDRQAMEEFRSCMEDQGVDLPEPPPAPGEDSGEGDEGARTFEHRLKPPTESERAKMDEAFEACDDKLPEGARHPGPPCGPPPGGPEGEGAAIPAPPPGSRDS